jgi:hypothetical protein
MQHSSTYVVVGASFKMTIKIGYRKTQIEENNQTREERRMKEGRNK